MATLSEVENTLETVAVDALNAAGYPEAAAFLDVLQKFLVIVDGVVAEKKLSWNPALAVQGAELGALAELDDMKTEDEFRPKG